MKVLQRFIVNHHQKWEILSITLIVGMVALIPMHWMAGATYKELEDKIVMLFPCLVLAISLAFYAKHLKAKIND